MIRSGFGAETCAKRRQGRVVAPVERPKHRRRCDRHARIGQHDAVSGQGAKRAHLVANAGNARGATGKAHRHVGAKPRGDRKKPGLIDGTRPCRLKQAQGGGRICGPTANA